MGTVRCAIIMCLKCPEQCESVAQYCTSVQQCSLYSSVLQYPLCTGSLYGTGVLYNVRSGTYLVQLQCTTPSSTLSCSLTSSQSHDHLIYDSIGCLTIDRQVGNLGFSLSAGAQSIFVMCTYMYSEQHLESGCLTIDLVQCVLYAQYVMCTEYLHVASVEQKVKCDEILEISNLDVEMRVLVVILCTTSFTRRF